MGLTIREGGGITSKAGTVDRLYQDQPALGGGAVKGACPNIDKLTATLPQSSHDDRPRISKLTDIFS
jgi:hypothetical protein